MQVWILSTVGVLTLVGEAPDALFFFFQLFWCYSAVSNFRGTFLTILCYDFSKNDIVVGLVCEQQVMSKKINRSPL